MLGGSRAYGKGDGGAARLTKFGIPYSVAHVPRMVPGVAAAVVVSALTQAMGVLPRPCTSESTLRSRPAVLLNVQLFLLRVSSDPTWTTASGKSEAVSSINCASTE